MSRSLAMNSGSLESLKVLVRCGTRPCAFQIACTEPRLIPLASAMARPVQCVASPGGSPWVSSTTRSTLAAGKGGVPGGRVRSRRSPSTPSFMNRSCQRHTQSLETPARRMIALVPSPSAVARMILARQTCFCGRLRSATTASRRARSAAETSTVIPSRILTISGQKDRMGTIRLGWSTRLARISHQCRGGRAGSATEFNPPGLGVLGWALRLARAELVRCRR
jgi:hypothetical protein